MADFDSSTLATDQALKDCTGASTTNGLTVRIKLNGWVEWDVSSGSASVMPGLGSSGGATCLHTGCFGGRDCPDIDSSAPDVGSCLGFTVCWLASHSSAIGTMGHPALKLMEIASLRYMQPVCSST